MSRLLVDTSIPNAIRDIDHKYINQYQYDNDVLDKYWYILLKQYKDRKPEWEKCNSNRMCKDSIQVFFQEKIVPYILYRWNTRIMSVFQEKRLASEYGKEGSKIKKFIEKTCPKSKEEEPEDILNADNNITEIKTHLQELLNEFLQCIDLPKDSAKGIAIILCDAREIFSILLFIIERSTNNSNRYDDNSGHFTEKYEQLCKTILDKNNFVQKFRTIIKKYNYCSEQLECELKIFLAPKALSIVTKSTDMTPSDDLKLLSPNTQTSSIVSEPEGINVIDSNDDIAELKDMSYSQFLSLLQSSASYSSDDIMTIMQHKWKEEDLKVFLDKDALLEAVENKPIQYVIFIHKDDKSELVHDARIIITESNAQIIEILIVVQDENNMKSFFDRSELAGYNNHHISLLLKFDEIVYMLFSLDKPEMNKNITNVLTIRSDLPYCENGVTDILFKKAGSHIKQINCFLQKLHKKESNYDCYNEFSTYLKENSGTQIRGNTIEQYYNYYIKINSSSSIKALKLNSIIQYCNKHSELENVQDFIKQIQTTLKENVYKGIDYVEAMGLDLDSTTTG